MFRRAKRTSTKNCTIQTEYGPISFVLKRSSARRSLVITVDESSQVDVAAPFNAREKEIFGFIHEKARWIERKIKESRKNRKILDEKKFKDDHKFLFLGKKCRINVNETDVKRSRIKFNDDSWTILVPRNIDENRRQALVKHRLVQWYKDQAQEVLGGRIFHYSRIIGVEPEKIAVRTQKRIWGNCDYHTKTIHLNWQIILAPIDVVDYVVVHELCHLIHPNHSKRFWKKVAKYIPDYEIQIRWLKENAMDLILPL